MSMINWEKLEQMKTHLVENVTADRFDMTDYLVTDSLDVVSDLQVQGITEMPCGTAGCILGHCILSPVINPELLKPMDFSDSVLNISGDTFVWDYLFAAHWEEYPAEGMNSLQSAIYRIEQLLQYKDEKWDVLNKLCRLAYAQSENTLNVA